MPWGMYAQNERSVTRYNLSIGKEACQMKRYVVSILAVLMAVMLVIGTTEAVDSYGPCQVTLPDGSRVTFRLAKTEECTLPLDPSSEETVQVLRVAPDCSTDEFISLVPYHWSGDCYRAAEEELVHFYADEALGKYFDGGNILFRHRGGGEEIYIMLDVPLPEIGPTQTESLLPDTSENPTFAFSDVAAGAYYADAVNWAVERGITTGTTPDTFSPDTVCTLGQAVTFLWRASGAPEPTVQNPFSNLSPDLYYAKAAVWAYEKGMVSGSKFNGNLPCSRSSMVTYLWKMAGKPQASQTITDVEQPWNLLLVNPWNKIPNNFTVSLSSVGGGHSVDSRCADALSQMLNDCRSAGMSPVICSSYRTEEKQSTLFYDRVAEYVNQGMSRDEAEALTAQSTAVPGTSEHQTGLAVDIVDNHNWNLDRSQASMPTQQWLMKHSWEYGFILRYPDDKTNLTGIIYEPWHYRYVGKEAAKSIYEQGICLEEYLQQMDEYEQAVAWAMEQKITTSTSSTAFLPNESCTRAQIVTFLYRSIA